MLENITCLPASTDILPEFVRLESEKVTFALTVKLPAISEFDDEAPEMVNGLLTKTKPPENKPQTKIIQQIKIPLPLWQIFFLGKTLRSLLKQLE